MIPQKIVPLFRQASAPLALPPPQAPKLLDQVREKIRLKHYSIRTEQTSIDWIRRYIPYFSAADWIPACAGMTESEKCTQKPAENGYQSS